MALFLNIYGTEMRKTLVILLIGIHLAGNTEAAQLLRLPQLLSHYFQHRQLDHDISFLQFISMHYGGDDGTSADDEYDGKLPCHNMNHSTISQILSPIAKDIPSATAVSIAIPVYHEKPVAGITSKHVLLILRPPRA